MNAMGFCHLGSAIYLALIVALVISVNENNCARKVIRETARRTFKLLAGLLIIALIVSGMTYFSG